jgi:hypothetical protein
MGQIQWLSPPLRYLSLTILEQNSSLHEQHFYTMMAATTPQHTLAIPINASQSAEIE